MGLGEEARQAAAAHAATRPADVPEHFVRAVAALGDPAAARARLEEYRSAGADLVVVYPVIVPGSAFGLASESTLTSVVLAQPPASSPKAISNTEQSGTRGAGRPTGVSDGVTACVMVRGK